MQYLYDPTSLFILCVIQCLTVSVYQTIRWKFMVSQLDVDEYTFLFPVIFKLFTNYKFSLSAKYISLKVKYNYTRCVFLSWVRNERCCCFLKWHGSFVIHEGICLRNSWAHVNSIMPPHWKIKSIFSYVSHFHWTGVKWFCILISKQYRIVKQVNLN